jgi:hypothetical protein
LRPIPWQLEQVFLPWQVEQTAFFKTPPVLPEPLQAVHIPLPLQTSQARMVSLAGSWTGAGTVISGEHNFSGEQRFRRTTSKHECRCPGH